MFARLPSRIVSNTKFVNMWGHCGSQARTMSADPHNSDTGRAKIAPFLWTCLSVVYMCMFTCVWTPEAATECLPQLLSTLCNQVVSLTWTQSFLPPCSGILSLPLEAGVTGRPPYPPDVSTGAEDLNSRPYTLHSEHLPHLYFAHL